MSRAPSIRLGGVELLPDLSGALYAPEFRVVIVADLHLEKGSSLARRGIHLPPYDTRATLAQLEGAIAHNDPEQVIFLGDSFHDGDARWRISDDDVVRLAAVLDGRDAIWITGNHDPAPPPDICAKVADYVLLGPLLLRHAPGPLADDVFEIAGHLHPAAAVAQRGHLIRCKCFIGDGRRLIMPAFGSFTGALSVSAEPFAAAFPTGEFDVWMLGARAVHKFPARKVR